MLNQLQYIIDKNTKPIRSRLDIKAILDLYSDNYTTTHCASRYIRWIENSLTPESAIYRVDLIDGQYYVSVIRKGSETGFRPIKDVYLYFWNHRKSINDYIKSL